MSEGEQPVVLASDADREAAALRDAVVEGRLTLEEFGDRVGRAHLARTRHDLAALLDGLPQPTPGLPASAEPRHVAFCSNLTRRGPWELPARSQFRSIFGTIDLDLREARLPGPAAELEIFNFFGTVTLLVPEGVAVSVEGGGLFASQEIDPPAAPAIADAPALRIRVSGPGGTLYVRNRERPGLLERLFGPERA